ncbi:MAG: glycosyltransferase [Armatimonadetes bacterium]|nr:glycosyltransferase [Armatimonadota bacterium]
MHSSFTGGHAAAADALVSALSELPNVQADSFNTLSVSSSTVQDGQKAFYNLVSNRVPTLRRIGFDLAINGSPVASAIGNAFLSVKAMLSPEVLEHFEREKPDLIVSTHSQTNSMLAYWKENGDLHPPVHSVLTDFLGHRMWAQDAIGHYYVATEAVRDDLERFGVDNSLVSVTGIPVKPALAAPPEPTEITCQRLGLDPHTPTILIMGGSLGDQKYADIIPALDRSPYPMQIVAITAKNADAKAELDQMRATLTHPLHVLGFTKNVEDYLRAADVVVTKPGGLTASEIFALRKPMIVANPYVGMEEHQAKRLSKTGVAWVANSGEEVRDHVERVLGDPTAGVTLTNKMNSVSHPDSAYQVADQVARAALAARTLQP